MADVRAGEWPQEVPLELADMMKEKAIMMPIIRRRLWHSRARFVSLQQQRFAMKDCRMKKRKK